MADGFVQVPADGPGKKIDTTEFTRSDGSVIERERVVIGDDDTTLRHVIHALTAIQRELQEIKLILAG